MSLGLCCQWLEKDKKDRDKNILISRKLQLGRYKKGLYTEERIRNTYIENLKNILEVLPKVIEAGIRSLRLSSSMFSFHDKVDPSFYDNEETQLLFKACGKVIKDNEIRLTMHPDQFAVLSSDEDHKVRNALTIIDFHAWVMDQMEIPQNPYYSINVHGGKSDRLTNLIKGINRLTDSARKRLTLENCEFAYSISELLPASKETGVPLCFDSHHHKFRTAGLSGKEAMEIAIETWPKDCRPNTHLSNTKREKLDSKHPRDLRQHSDYIYEIPDYQLKANNNGLIDIDIEAKKKNYAVVKAAELGLQLVS